MLSSISDDVKGEGCRQSLAKPRGSIRGMAVFKVNKGGKYKVEG